MALFSKADKGSKKKDKSSGARGKGIGLAGRAAARGQGTVEGTVRLPGQVTPRRSLLARFSMREKMLVLLLLVIGLVCAFVMLVLLPTTEDINKLKDQESSLTQQRAMATGSIAGLAPALEAYDQSRAVYDQAVKLYIGQANPEQIDRTLTTILQDCGFEPATMVLNGLAYEHVSPYATPVLESQVPAPAPLPEIEASDDDDAQGAGTGTDTADPGGSAEAGAAGGGSGGTGGADSTGNTGEAATGTSGDVYVYTAQYAASGDMEMFYKLLDAVSQYSWLRLQAYSYEPSSATSGTNEPEFSFTFKIYLLPESEAKLPAVNLE
jgi:hypothetical protein